MLTVLYNDDLVEGNYSKNPKVKFEVKDSSIICHYNEEDTDDQDKKIIDYDVIQKLDSYNSYALVKKGSCFPIKIEKKVHMSTCLLLNLNKLGTAIKEDFGRIALLYSYSIIAQIDTGMIAENNSDIVINVMGCSKKDIEIVADSKYEMKPSSMLNGKYPRETLWDNYSLIVNGNEYKADRWGNVLEGNNNIPLICSDGKDYIEFKIIKYKGFFTEQKLNRNIDDEEVFIESSVGLCNPTRIKLQNGVADFRIYPFGYRGAGKIKLGRKWYSVWNDYSFDFA